MDKALDEIISTRPKRGSGRRASSRRSGGRQQLLGSTAPVSPSARARAAQSLVPKSVPSAAPLADKIIVSNLPPDVNEQQVRELFQSMVGHTKEVTLNFDANGRSKGVAAVHFSKKGDGNKAYQQYNNRLIDGKRPMKIEIIVDPNAPLPLSSRVAPAPAVTNGATAPTRGARPRRGRGRGGRSSRAERPAKSVADLDAEMEDYTASNSAPAVTAA